MNNLHRQQTQEERETSGQDDIQDIILKAQKSYFMKRNGSKTTGHQNSGDSGMQHADFKSTDSKESPHKGKRLNNDLYEPQILSRSNSKSKIEHIITEYDRKETKRSSNYRHTDRDAILVQKSRNNLMAHENSSDELYINTQHEIEEEQARQYIHQPVNQHVPEMQKFTFLKNSLEASHEDLLAHENMTFMRITDPTKAKGRNGYQADHEVDQPHVRSQNDALKLQLSDQLTSSRSMQLGIKKEISPISQYRLKRFEKSVQGRNEINHSAGSRVKSTSSKEVESQTLKQKLPPIIKEFKKSVDRSIEQTQFSKNFGKLLDRIADLYPNFAKIANSSSIHPSLSPEDLLRAENVFNQLNFMYMHAKDSNYNNTGNFGDFEKNLQSTITQLKDQLKKSEREMNYHSNQVVLLQAQLKEAKSREQKSEAEYEKKLEVMTKQVRDYEFRVDNMQLRLDQYSYEQEDKNQGTLQSQISFRDSKHVEFTDNNESENRFGQLMNNVKELKQKLRHKDEMVSYEKDNNKVLHDKINRMNDAFALEIQSNKKEIKVLQDKLLEKENEIRRIKNQMDNVSLNSNLEFPILITKESSDFNQTSINLTNHRSKIVSKVNTPKFINMKKAVKSSAVEDELDMSISKIMGGGFEDDIIISTLNKSQKTTKKNGGRPIEGKQAKMQQYQSLNLFSQNVVQMFHLSDVYRSQITAVQAVDDILKDMQKIKKESISKVDSQLEQAKKFHDKSEVLIQQKSELAGKVQELTADNECLKHKFSQLLDQFQEYVNESERKLEEENFHLQSKQSQLMNSLTNSIKDLEDINRGLQDEISQKTLTIKTLEEENLKLSKELQSVDEIKQQLKIQNETTRQEAQNMQEDLKYLKKQYKMDLEALRQENSNLQIKVREKSADHNNYKCNDSLAELDYNNPFTETRLNRQNSQIVDRGHRRQGSSVSPTDQIGNRNNRFNEQDQELLMLSSHEANRAKSQDRVQAPGAPDQKSSNYNKSPNFERQRTSYEEKKREMLDKDRLIEQKNKEIVKLRLENDELRDFCQNRSNSDSKVQSRQQILHEISDFLDNIYEELQKTKSNLFGKDGSHSPMRTSQYRDTQQKNSSIVVTEDQLLNALFEKTQVMSKIETLMGEVYLISSQQRFPNMKQTHRFQNTAQASVIKITEQEYQKLLQENTQLERLVSHYEQTLTKLDLACNNDDQGALIELKRIQQQQLLQIAQLQKENNIMQEQLTHQEQSNIGVNSMQKIQQESRVLKQEIQMLREVEIRAQNLKKGNDELLHERNQLLNRIEQHEQIQSDQNLQIQDVQLQVADRDAQLEELRNRITTIAELFEKKPIKQRYSFEVLCDFVHDKAKRLFTKYENAVKDKKALQNDDKTGRKMFKLEQEIKSLKEHAKFLKNTIVPTLLTMLNKENHNDDLEEVNPQFIRQLLLETEYEFKRMRKEVHDNGQTIQSNLQKIENLQKALDQVGDARRSNPTFRVSPSRPPMNQNIDDQLHQMKMEKDQLNSKLDEFSMILREFQANQKKYELENSQLKMKLNQYEGNIENHSMLHGANLINGSIGLNEPSITASGYSYNNRANTRNAETNVFGKGGFMGNFSGANTNHQMTTDPSPMKQLKQ